MTTQNFAIRNSFMNSQIKSVRSILMLLIPMLLVTSQTAIAQEQQAEAEKHFTLNVLPIFKTKCFGCHGDNKDDLLGEFDMTSMELLLEGGESEDPALVIGKPDESPIIEAIKWDGLEMPPKENDRLSEEQIEDVVKWVADGAVWPSEERQTEIKTADWANDAGKEGETVKTSGGLSDDWTYRRYKSEDLWSIRPLKKPAEPDGGYSIDSFVDRKLSAAQVAPAPTADARTLIRRANYDLTGLPPTPEEDCRV